MTRTLSLLTLLAATLLGSGCLQFPTMRPGPFANGFGQQQPPVGPPPTVTPEQITPQNAHHMANLLFDELEWERQKLLETQQQHLLEPSQ